MNLPIGMGVIGQDETGGEYTCSLSPTAPDPYYRELNSLEIWPVRVALRPILQTMALHKKYLQKWGDANIYEKVGANDRTTIVN